MTTVLIASTWSYRDAWAPMAHSLLRYWPDCPWLRCLMTDCPESHKGDVRVFSTSFTLATDRGWCANLLAAIDSGIYSPPYLLLQEDFLLCREVDTGVMQAMVRVVAEESSVGCLRLYPCPGPADDQERLSVLGVPVGEVFPGEPYRVSCQAAIWSEPFLRACLKAGTERGGGPMDFEFAGDATAKADGSRVLSVLRSAKRKPLEYLCTAIVRGQWSRDAVAMIRSWGLDPGTRAVQEA